MALARYWIAQSLLEITTSRSKTTSVILRLSSSVSESASVVKPLRLQALHQAASSDPRRTPAFSKSQTSTTTMRCLTIIRWWKALFHPPRCHKHFLIKSLVKPRKAESLPTLIALAMQTMGIRPNLSSLKAVKKLPSSTVECFCLMKRMKFANIKRSFTSERLKRKSRGTLKAFYHQGVTALAVMLKMWIADLTDRAASIRLLWATTSPIGMR